MTDVERALRLMREFDDVRVKAGIIELTADQRVLSEEAYEGVEWLARTTSKRVTVIDEYGQPMWGLRPGESAAELLRRAGF